MGRREVWAKSDASQNKCHSQGFIQYFTKPHETGSCIDCWEIWREVKTSAYKCAPVTQLRFYLIKMLFVLTNVTCNLRGNRPQMHVPLLSPYSKTCVMLYLFITRSEETFRLVSVMSLYYILFNKLTREFQKQNYKHVSVRRQEKFRPMDASPKTKTTQSFSTF